MAEVTKFYIFFFLIVSLSIIIYINTLGNDFIWDDVSFVVSNDFIKNLKFIPLYFTSRHALAKGTLTGENYRPVLVLSYALDYFFWKLNPAGYHLSNAAFHSANAILLFYLVLLITKDRYVGLFSSLVFLAHPIQTEAVSWVSGRADVLFLFFFLLSFITYLKHKKEGRLILYFASVLFFSFALLSKEMAATLPFILILYDWLYSKRENLSLNAIRYFPFFVVLELYFFIRFAVIGRFSQGDYWTGNFYTTFLTMLSGIRYYIKLLLYPVNLCADYLTFPISTSIRDYRVLLSLLIIFGLLMLSLFLRKRLRHISFSFLWFFVTLGPVMNIIPIRILIAERFLYLPSIGYAIAVAVLFKFFSIRYRRSPLFRYGLFSFQVALIFIYSYFTVVRNTDWANEIVFNTKIIEKYPQNWRAHHNLALAYMNDNELEKAYGEMKITLESRPGHYRTRMLLANYYIQKDRPEDAINELKYVIAIKPDFVNAYKLLASIYITQERYNDAYRQYQKMFAWDVSNREAKEGMARLENIR